MPVEAYVAEPVAESSALETSVVNAGGEVSTAEEIVSEQEVAAGQLPSTDTAHAGLPSVESPATEAPVAASAADISSVTSKLLDGIEIELAADGLVIRETAEAESPRDVPPDGDHTVVEPAEAEWQPKIIPATENTSEIVALENQAPEAVADENVATAEKSAAIQNVEVDWEENQSEAVAPPPDEIGQNATDVESSLVEPLGIEAVAEAESGSEAEETLATRTVDTPPVNDSLSIEPPGADSTEVEPQTGVEEASPDVSEVGTDTSIGQKGMPESDNNLESKEKAPAHVSDARAGRVLSGPSEGASRKSLAGHGIFNLPRVPEPEVMDDAEQVEAYASAAAQEWLNKIDDSFVEHASRLVQGRPRGRALDIGAGPGQIALKLALKLSLWKIIGVDRSQKMIDEALAKLTASPAATGRLEFRVADGNRLDFPNATFELVICNSVLHHLAEPQKLLSELARVAKPRGAILLRDLRRPSRLQYALHVRWHGRHYAGKMFQLYRDSVRAAYTVPELQKLLNVSQLRGARVFRHGSTHIGIERPYNS
jgi:ubiquinone/menaquinone biosynthesis C-methylase UbiE